MAKRLHTLRTVDFRIIENASKKTKVFSYLVAAIITMFFCLALVAISPY